MSKRSPSISVVGLGLMGTAFTERLLEYGWRLFVWNRSAEKAQPLIVKGAVWTDEPFAVSDRVIVSLYDSAAVREVIEAMKPQLRPGMIIIDTTTGEPEQSMRLATELAEQGIRYLEAPVSGSSEQARRGEATAMVGGDRAAFEACADLWPMLGAKVFHCGPSGSAAKMKLITNLVLGLNRAVLAEGLVFAESQGVPAAAALEVMRDSMAYSRAMDVKGRKMIEGDFTPQARLSQHLKDVRLMLQSAERAGLALPLSATHRELLEQAEAAGFGELDNSAIIKVMGADKQ